MGVKVLSSSVICLRDNINSAFSLSEEPTLQQHWDSEFNDWTDAEDIAALETMD